MNTALNMTETLKASSRSSLSLKQVRHLTCLPLTFFKGDRFIPNRMAMNRDVSHYNLVAAVPTPEEDATGLLCSEAESAQQYKSTLAKSLFGEDSSKVEDHKILALKNKAPAPNPAHQNHLKVLYSQNLSQKKSAVAVSSDAYQTLDAPGMVLTFTSLTPQESLMTTTSTSSTGLKTISSLLL